MNEPVGPTPEVARKNIVMAIVLTALVLLIAAGTIVVSLIYLHYD